MIITLDPGFGNTKVVADGKVSVLQSSVAKPKFIGNAAIGMESYKAEKEILADGVEYVVGGGAWLQGNSIGNMDYSSLADYSKKILFYASLSEVLDPNKNHKATMIIGLPVDLLQNPEESANLIKTLRDLYITSHEWESKGNHYSLKITGATAAAQPVGAWADYAITDNFKLKKDVLNEEIAIIDLGMNTLDLFVVKDRRVIDKFVSGTKVGVRNLLTTMNGHGQGLEEIDYDLRTGALQAKQDDLESWLNEILGNVEKAWPDLRRFSHVIPVGGGMIYLKDMLKNSLIRKRAKVHCPDNPIVTNAMGLWKWGMYNAKK